MLCAEDEQGRICWMTAFRLLKVRASVPAPSRLWLSGAVTPLARGVWGASPRGFPGGGQSQGPTWALHMGWVWARAGGTRSTPGLPTRCPSTPTR